MHPDAHPLDNQQVVFSAMLTVSDLAVSEAFYVCHFGFRVTERLESLCRIAIRVSLYLVTESSPKRDKPNVTLTSPTLKAKPSVNLNFRVRDVRATTLHLWRCDWSSSRLRNNRRGKVGVVLPKIRTAI